MKLLLVRHGESTGNAEERLQGQRDYPLTERGKTQTRELGRAFARMSLQMDAVYVSPLSRATETAACLAKQVSLPEPTLLSDLREIAFGRLEGLKRADMEREAPEFLARGIESLADYGEFGGESYEDVQARVGRVLSSLFECHRAPGHTVLIVGHGGFNFQLAKSLVCSPVPRVCSLRMGNCSSTLIHLTERRGTFLGEVVWHAPLALWGGAASEGALGLLR